MSIKWICKHHTALSKEQLYAILQLRAQVFVVEQKCFYLDVDGLDLQGDTRHLMAWQGDELVAYLRLLDPIQQNGDVTIGRVVTAPSMRRKGMGHELMVQALEHAERNWPDQPIYLSAQAHLRDYYSGYGFNPVGEVYVEDGIPHLGMRRDLD